MNRLSSAMRSASRVTGVWIALATALVASPQSGPPPVATGAPLTIVVIAGEDAVNVIQQRTAVTPIVEVRDRNGLPVSGATVTFAISGSNTATFGGATTVTVTTNAAGQAAASAFSPLSAGPVQINVQAAFQGQSAVAAITQTNVLTAAEAAAASSAAGGAAGGGGGLSGTTVAGLVGGAGAAAAAGVALAGSQSDSPSATTTHTGTYAGQGSQTFTVLFPTGSSACTHLKTLTGSLSVTLRQQGEGTITGTASTAAVLTVVGVSGNCTTEIPVIGNAVTLNWDLTVGGSAQRLTLSGQQPYAATPFSGGTLMGRRTITFEGSLSGGTIAGTLTVEESADGTTLGSPLTSRGSSTASVTLR
jgi:hypothetical protein